MRITVKLDTFDQASFRLCGVVARHENAPMVARRPCGHRCAAVGNAGAVSGRYAVARRGRNAAGRFAQPSAPRSLRPMRKAHRSPMAHPKAPAEAPRTMAAWARFLARPTGMSNALIWKRPSQNMRFSPTRTSLPIEWRTALTTRVLSALECRCVRDGSGAVAFDARQRSRLPASEKTIDPAASSFK